MCWLRYAKSAALVGFVDSMNSAASERQSRFKQLRRLAKIFARRMLHRSPVTPRNTAPFFGQAEAVAPATTALKTARAREVLGRFQKTDTSRYRHRCAWRSLRTLARANGRGTLAEKSVVSCAGRRRSPRGKLHSPSWPKLKFCERNQAETP